MALTTTQVNQAFLATLGRPAEGSAATWGSTSLSLGALGDSIFIAENTDGDFVEYLYQNIIGRASDAEGKEFWNSLLATTSKEAVLAQFKAAVLAAGKADPSNADYQSFIATNKAFVTNLYTNLLGRDDAKTADAEGVEFWANALTTGMSRGDLISAFVSAASSDPNSDDAKTLTAKLSVADAITANFKDFNADVTAGEKKAAYAQLVAQMKEVVAGSTVEEFQDAINQFKGQNQDRKTDVFTKGEDDLDASESTAATTFRGTINISAPDKSTIESGDAATGNSDFAAANTLIVDVKSDGKEKDFNFNTETTGVKVSNVSNLTINNGTADVTLELRGGDNYTGKVAIAGKGDRADVTVAQDVASLSVSTSGAKKAYADTTVTTAATLGAFEGSAAVDTLTINGTIAKSINTGDGADNVTLGADAKVYEKATINLGAGDDTLTINTGNIGNHNADGEITENLKASVTIDGGAGTKDKLVLSSDISKGVKAITGVELIDSTAAGAISAAAADGLKTTVSGTLTINADYKEAKSINLKDIKSSKNDSNADTGSLTVKNVTNENITLSSNIKEKIVVTAHTATTPKNYAEISKFAAGDRVELSGIINSASVKQATDKTLDLTRYADVKDTLADKTTGDVVAINDAAGKKAYIWQVLDDTDARLVAVVDKKLKVSDNGFILDGSTTQTEEQGTTSTIKYVSGSTTLDIGEGNYGTGTKTQFFNIPANEKDVLKVVLDGNYSQIGSLRVDNSGDNKGTVEVHVLDGVNVGSNINVTAVKDKIYLGEGRNNLDASNYTFIGADALVANTIGKLTVAFDSLGTAVNKAKLDLTNVNANVTISGDVTNGTDVNTLFVNASGNDTITLTTNISNAQNITLTDAAENVTVKTAITADANLTNMLKGAAANDTISAKIGTDDNQALALTLSNAKDTIDVSTAQGTGGALTITTTGFDKANDKIYFGPNATKGKLENNITLAAKVGDGADNTKINTISVTDGKVSLLTTNNTAVTGDNLTVAKLLTALQDNNAKTALINQVLLFTDNAGANYLVTAGATNAATNDVAIALTGVATESFEISNGFVTLA